MQIISSTSQGSYISKNIIKMSIGFNSRNHWYLYFIDKIGNNAEIMTLALAAPVTGPDHFCPWFGLGTLLVHIRNYIPETFLDWQGQSLYLYSAPNKVRTFHALAIRLRPIAATASIAAGGGGRWWDGRLCGHILPIH